MVWVVGFLASRWFAGFWDLVMPVFRVLVVVLLVWWASCCCLRYLCLVLWFVVLLDWCWCMVNSVVLIKFIFILIKF